MDIQSKNSASMESFKTLRRNWINWLHKEIWPEIHNMMANDAYFKVINELPRIANENPDESVEINGAIFEMITTGYVAYQLMSIRRLCDDTGDAISLRNLLKDISRNLSKITRENYVCYEEIPYDYDLVYSQWLESVNPSSGVMVGVPTKGNQAWGTSERLHENFDRLSGVCSKESRTREDLIDKKVVESLIKTLGACDDLTDLATQYIAHNSNPEKKRNIKEWNLTLGKIEIAHEIICKVANFIEGDLLYESPVANFCPIPQYGHLNSLSKPWIKEDNIKKIYEFWDKYAEKVDSYKYSYKI